MANQTGAPGSFSRDLGYLDKFLASLSDHAQGLADPQKQQLLSLLSEERSRWDQIKALLAGQAPASAAPAKSTAPQAPPAPDPSPTRGWTVGSLMKR